MATTAQLTEPHETVFAVADRALSAIGLHSILARDALLAVVVAIASATVTAMTIDFIVTAESIVATSNHFVAVVTLVALQSLALIIRRYRPIACVALIVALQLVGFALLPYALVVRGFAPIFAAYSVGAHVSRRRGTIAIIAAVVVESVLGAIASLALSPALQRTVFAVDGTRSDVGLLQLVFLIAVVAGPTYIGSALIGRMVATRREYLALVRLRAVEAIDEQRERADAAIVFERTRMARELHDIAAHHLSGIAVQAAAVERLIDSDPTAAKESVKWIRAQSRETLANLRIAVGMLRDGRADERDDSGAPVPGLAVIESLVAGERALGCDVSITFTGLQRELSPIADIAFYRVAQESLANARDHAPGSAVTMSLSFTPELVELEVRNNHTHEAQQPARHRGLGLIGMGERASLIGATLSTGTEGAEWVVRLSLPLIADAA